VPVAFLRDGRSRTAELVIEPAGELAGGDLDRRLAGAVFSELPPSLRNLRLSGVLLASLERSSRLASEGLRPGDVITAVNQERVANLAGFRQALRRARGPLLLQLRRDGEAYVARID
jgi:S1-C subfamily serine protease